ncbi:MAG: hypothetical protein AAGH38_07950 [Pseudomonadota bacterium]
MTPSDDFDARTTRESSARGEHTQTDAREGSNDLGSASSIDVTDLSTNQRVEEDAFERRARGHDIPGQSRSMETPTPDVASGDTKPVEETQLAFELPNRPPKLGRSAFIATDGNTRDLETLMSWLQSDSRLLVICGPASAGKTHLASIVAEEGDTQWIIIGDDGRLPLAQLRSTPAPEYVILDQVERLKKPDQLLEIIQRCRMSDSRLLLVGSGRVEDWAGDIVDVSTRLQAASYLCMSEPDEGLLRQVMTKLFDDRQIAVPISAVEYAARRLPRRLADIARFVDAVDRVSAEAGVAITWRLAEKVLEQFE